MNSLERIGELLTVMEIGAKMQKAETLAFWLLHVIVIKWYLAAVL